MRTAAADVTARPRPWAWAGEKASRPAEEVPPQALASHRRRGRAALVWGLALFVLAQAALRCYIERQEPVLRDPTFELKCRQLARCRAACPGPPVTVVFFGSSITLYGIEAGLLDEPLARALHRPAVAFNFGVHSSGPLSQLVYVRRLLERGIRPDLAVLEVTPLVYDSPQTFTDLGLLPASGLRRGEVELVRHYTHDPDLGLAWLEAFLVPVYGNRHSILNYRASLFVPFTQRMYVYHEMDAHGWIGQDPFSPEAHRPILQRVQSHFGARLADYAVARPPMQATTELLDLLRKERVPAVLAYLPEGPLLRSLYPPGAVARFVGEIKALSRTYGVPFVEARDWLGEDMFVDSHHANRVGAAAMTERLGREAIVPLLARQGDARAAR
jgi:hypothetical protein